MVPNLVSKTCNVHECDEEAVWYFQNPIKSSTMRGPKCDKHAKRLAHQGYTYREMINDRTLRPIQDMEKAMTDGGQPLDPEHYEILSNAGRCDICGKPIDMSNGDVFTTQEFTVDEETEEEYGITDQECANAVADALERVGDSGADYDLAKTIREDCAMRAHQECLDETAYNMLTEEPEDDTQ